MDTLTAWFGPPVRMLPAECLLPNELQSQSSPGLGLHNRHKVFSPPHLPLAQCSLYQQHPHWYIISIIILLFICTVPFTFCVISGILFVCGGNWVHYTCDKLRGLRREIERGVDTSEVWRSHFSPCPLSPCPTGLQYNQEKLKGGRVWTNFTVNLSAKCCFLQFSHHMLLAAVFMHKP